MAQGCRLLLVLCDGPPLIQPARHLSHYLLYLIANPVNFTVDWLYNAIT